MIYRMKVIGVRKCSEAYRGFYGVPKGVSGGPDNCLGASWAKERGHRIPPRGWAKPLSPTTSVKGDGPPWGAGQPNWGGKAPKWGAP